VVVACAAAGFADPASGAPMSADGACHWFSIRKIATVTAAMVVAERSDPALAGVPRVTAHHCLPRALAPAGRGTAPARDPRHPQGKFVAPEAFDLDGAAYGGLTGPVTDAARPAALHCGGSAASRTVC
jgi:hypothetical protein